MSAKIVIEGKADKPLPFFRLETLKKRSEFKQAAGGPRYSTKSFTMLRRLGLADAPAAASVSNIRFGFTVTKRVGNSVVRNRIRRRLREAVRAASAEFPKMAQDQGPLDLVILARRDALELDFKMMVADIARAVSVLATRGERKPAPTKNTPPPSQKAPDNGNIVLS